ncbi:hypothetical protein MFLAVUS_008154 [Mucor flavus]|uniref:Uncharacterized protein n=1 Tax=Mucor flavus TaxID=439312 RepID=A0ABP9Z6B7_9FUNG
MERLHGVPLCETKLESFKTVKKSPQPHKRTSRSTVVCHRLLSQCFHYDNSEQMRLRNRDLAAVLNFRKILYNGKRPSVLTETNPPKLSLWLINAQIVFNISLLLA